VKGENNSIRCIKITSIDNAFKIRSNKAYNLKNMLVSQQSACTIQQQNIGSILILDLFRISIY